jgi:hypothetical protein
MSDVREKVASAAERGRSEKDGKKGKMKFTPPVLHEYGEVVKICQENATFQGNDEFGGIFS